MKQKLPKVIDIDKISWSILTNANLIVSIVYNVFSIDCIEFCFMYPHDPQRIPDPENPLFPP